MHLKLTGLPILVAVSLLLTACYTTDPPPDKPLEPKPPLCVKTPIPELESSLRFALRDTVLEAMLQPHIATVGSRTYLRMGDSTEFKFQVEDSGKVSRITETDTLQEPYFRRDTLEILPLRFNSLAVLDSLLRNTDHPLFIEGCLEAPPAGFLLGNTPLFQFGVQSVLTGDSLVIASEGGAKYSGSHSRFVFGLKSGLLSAEDVSSMHPFGSITQYDAVYLERIPEDDKHTCAHPYRIDSIPSGRLVFAFDSSGGNFVGGNGIRYWKGTRTYTRAPGDSVGSLFDVVDSGKTEFKGSIVPDSAATPYSNKFQVRFPPLSFGSMAALAEGLSGKNLYSSIAGCADAWSDSVKVNLDVTQRKFSVAGDSLHFNISKIGYKGSSSTHIVFGAARGLLSLERAFSGFMGSGNAFSLKRIE